jgi:1,4-dihydroxy-2-naphthoate octaprenyltransferase
VKRSTLLHLRFPFSFFLLPVYILAVATANTAVELWPLLGSFLVLHFMLYPASNGYNSYFDKDEQSIGGLKHPPKVSKELYWISLMLDGMGLILAWWIDLWFMVFALIYGLISKAYSHPSIRLKKYPIIGWLAAGIFQGYFTYLMTIVAVTDVSLEGLFAAQYQWPALLSTLMLFGSYPMTQVYQHEEDRKRGDITISLRLGIRGTFHFTMVVFSLAVAGFVYYFLKFQGEIQALLFPLMLAPVLVYFFYWYLKVLKSSDQADFEHTMRLNLLSAICLNAYFLLLWLY